jgi:hypothetical protein
MASGGISMRRLMLKCTRAGGGHDLLPVVVVVVVAASRPFVKPPSFFTSVGAGWTDKSPPDEEDVVTWTTVDACGAADEPVAATAPVFDSSGTDLTRTSDLVFKMVTASSTWKVDHKTTLTEN